MIATLSAAILGIMAEPKIEDLTWMAGRWECEIWGGTWQETWSEPRGGVMQSFARHLVDGKAAFIEFGTIERGSEGLTHFLILGALTKEPKRSAVKCTSAGPKEAGVGVLGREDLPGVQVGQHIGDVRHVRRGRYPRW